jgi:hypothetical protein
VNKIVVRDGMGSECEELSKSPECMVQILRRGWEAHKAYLFDRGDASFAKKFYVEVICIFIGILASYLKFLSSL